VHAGIFKVQLTELGMLEAFGKGGQVLEFFGGAFQGCAHEKMLPVEEAHGGGRS
jgi:hypothetical protein